VGIVLLIKSSFRGLTYVSRHKILILLKGHFKSTKEDPVYVHMYSSVISGYPKNSRKHFFERIIHFSITVKSVQRNSKFWYKIHLGNNFKLKYLREFSAKKISSKGTSNGTRRSYLMKKPKQKKLVTLSL